MGKNNLPDKQQALCGVCGHPIEDSLLEAEESAEKVCFKCQAARAAENIPPQDPLAVKGRKSNRRKIMLILQGLVLTVCIIAFFSYLPTITRTIRTSSKPVRYGSYETDPLTDQCLENLWRAVKFIQEEKEIPPDLVCPVSGQTYHIQMVADDVIISCPAPEKHGFTRIFSSRSYPVPQLRNQP